MARAIGFQGRHEVGEFWGRNTSLEKSLLANPAAYRSILRFLGSFATSRHKCQLLLAHSMW